MTAFRVPMVWVDAFCERPFGGNPAAVCLLERPAPEAAMQSLAFELGLSETAYAWPDGDGYSLRWFTPAAEVDLCGHATVATAYALHCAGHLGSGSVRFHTRSGVLVADVEGETVVLDLPADPPVPADPPPDLPADWPVVGAAMGRWDLVIELPDAGAVAAVEAGAAAGAARRCRGVIVTAPGGGGPGAAAAGSPDYVLRFFAPAVGVPEDPVTGSAQCTLGPYWAEKLGRSELLAVQLSSRRGILQVATAGDRVRVGGRAVTILEGHVTGRAAELLLGDG